jgi:hypothetical protein
MDGEPVRPNRRMDSESAIVWVGIGLIIFTFSILVLLGR